MACIKLCVAHACLDLTSVIAFGLKKPAAHLPDAPESKTGQPILWLPLHILSITPMFWLRLCLVKVCWQGWWAFLIQAAGGIKAHMLDGQISRMLSHCWLIPARAWSDWYRLALHVRTLRAGSFEDGCLHFHHAALCMAPR